MNIWHNISPSRITPERFIAVIEVQKGSKMKYELDKETGLLILDRVLYTSTHYYTSYGFIPRTLADDGDPLDVLVMCAEPLMPLSLVNVYPIGAINMIDDGRADQKVIAIPYGDPSYNSYSSIDDLPIHVFEEMSHFFKVYKELEGKKTDIVNMMDREETTRLIAQTIENYELKYEQKNEFVSSD